MNIYVCMCIYVSICMCVYTFYIYTSLLTIATVSLQDLHESFVETKKKMSLYKQEIA